MSELRRLKIGTTDIFLENLGSGEGKIIISDPYGGNFSHYWGSMGETIEKFLLRIDFSYFHMKVNPYDNGEFDAKSSVTNIRRVIREDFSYELPWYEHMEAQKELRKELKRLEKCYDEHDFVDSCNRLADNLYLLEMSRFEKEQFRQTVRDIMSEPWHYIGTKSSNETLFLKRLFPKLQKQLKKEVKNLVDTN